MNSPIFPLRLFGSPSIAGEDGAPLGGRAAQRHRLALLAMLALAPGRSLSRERSMAFLWPERDTEHARQLLNQAVYNLRKALCEAAILSRGDELRLNPEVVRADVAEFEAALSRGETGRAVELYHGPFLDGFFLNDAPEFERWAERERERLTSTYAKAIELVAEAAERERDFGTAAEWWKRRAAHDPFDSRVALRVMQALEAGGNRAGAIQHAAIHQRLLEEELGMGSAPEVVALAERLRTEPLAERPVLRRPAEAPEEGGPEPARRSDEEPEVSLPTDASPARSTHPFPAAAGGGGKGRRSRLWGAALLLAVVSLVGAVWAAWPRADEPERSIVVLPFLDMSPDEDNEHFSDGLTEEIITRLSAVPELKVISRTSAMHYKGSGKPLREIADDLDVAHVLEGSVRQDGGRLRITAQLIDARADAHLWARSYDRDLRDIFSVQEEIALEVVGALRVELGERERRLLGKQGTRDPGAYELYRRGRDLWSTRTKEGHERAIAYFRQAIARDSTYADAHAALAAAHVTAFQHNVATMPEAELYARARAAAERALALDDESAEAHAVQGTILQWRRDWPGAERALRRALELNPGGQRGWYALLLSGMGRTDEALRELRRSRGVDPLVPVTYTTSGRLCYVARDHACAVEQYRKALAINPLLGPAHQGLGLAYAQQGLVEEAHRSLARAAELDPAFLPDLAYGLARAGRRQAALDTLARAKQAPFEPFYVARAYVALAEPDSAFAWLERSNWKWPHRAVRSDPALDPVRSDPRFARLEERVEREMGMR